MPLSWNEIRLRASNFVNEWKNKAPKAREEADAHDFQTDFLNIFGVTRRQVATFEHRVNIGGQPDLFGDNVGGRRGYIDLFWKGRIIIEMKTPGKDRTKAFQQAKEYAENLPPNELPSCILISDFVNFDFYNLDKDGESRTFTLHELPRNVELFGFLAGYKDVVFQAVSPVDIEAAEHMGELHDALKENKYTGHELEMYLVRLLFCLFADDTGIFEEKKTFYKYIKEKTSVDGNDLAIHLGLIFEMLNKPKENRQTNRDEVFTKFPYVNGGLFEERLPTAAFNSKMRDTILRCCTLDWSQIKPEIFGAMFQSVKDKEKRRELGEHYTSETNILKVIRPLFLDALWEEFESIRKLSFALRKQRLLEFHTKLRELQFLDPACGCGNFLVVSYRELRLLEIEVIAEYLQGQQMTDIDLIVRVNVDQFYGIEIEEFPARIAQTALWLMDHLMNMKASSRFGKYIVRIPLTASSTIIIGNALTTDWESVVSKDKLSYILGNPPFIGHQWRNPEQQEDMKIVYKDNSNYGKLDYVCCWYQKAIDYMLDTKIKAAFVSTNSIVQGESVSIMWQPIFNRGFEIGFAYKPFVWSNEARGKAAVHCVIIGFSKTGNFKNKQIFDQDAFFEAKNINGYLLTAPNVFIQSRGKPLTHGLPEMSKGSQPTDGGNLILSVDEREQLLTGYPQAKGFIKRFLQGDDFINSKLRYCLWLKGVAPKEYRSIKPIIKRLENVTQMRKKSPTMSVQRDAEIPMLFTQIRQPETDFIAVPEVSSERRKYIPMGFLTPDVIAGNQLYIISNATLYIFGILTSNMHMAWTRQVCGRLEMRYRYSPAVYNNFPFPNPTDKQKGTIEAAAQKVLDTRSQFPNSSLADLYDPLTMPPELLKAHQKLDNVVETAYDRSFDTDSERVAYLFELYPKIYGELFVGEKRRGKGMKRG